jgi:hypothetical protein
MNVTLTRNEFASDGIFGGLYDDSNKFRCSTLEHAYATLDGIWIPKVAAGTYTCRIHPPNRLPYTTFELQNVPDFEGKSVTGVLLHILNFDSQSEGCIGLGKKVAATGNGTRMLTDSKDAFNEFMALQKNVTEFSLIIKDNK